MNIEESLKKLYSLHQFGVKLGLDKPKELFTHIGNPQNKLKCFHIAGSNAKGSVASFIASILIEEGYKVGLYTSPHFVKFNERIRINGEMVSDEYVTKFMNELDNYIDQNSPTFFELTTAMAFKYFDENNVDYAVIETGLGGRLDATNVINPLASVITTISLEHTNILGDTIEQIAYEKGEIIKNNSKVITGFLPEEAMKVLNKKANSVDSRLYSIIEYSKVSSNYIQLNYEREEYKIYSTPLGGKYQRKNAALAILTLLSTIKLQSAFSIFDGISNVVSNSGIQGRYEIYSDKPRIIFDSSHNTEGIENFISEFKNEKDNYTRKEIIFGVMKDKDITGMLSKFDKNFDKIMVTTFDYERAAKIEEIKDIAENLGVEVEGISNPSDYILNYLKGPAESCLVLLGSIYLLGDIKSKLLSNRLDI